MDYLSQGSAPFDDVLWQKITDTVVTSARNHLVGRKFISIYGPLGSGATNVPYDRGQVEEIFDDGIVKTQGRNFAELPQIYEDFLLRWRDIEASQSQGLPLDLSAVKSAAQTIANNEDKLIFYGNKGLKIDGLLTVAGANKVKLSDWKVGENAFTDIVSGVVALQQKGIMGKYVLCVSPALYIELQRIQPGTGMLEKDRVASLLGGLFTVPILKGRQAVLMNAEQQNIDLAIGVDMNIAYLELKDLNHNCRIMETVLPRIKRPESIVIYE